MDCYPAGIPQCRPGTAWTWRLVGRCSPFWMEAHPDSRSAALVPTPFRGYSFAQKSFQASRFRGHRRPAPRTKGSNNDGADHTQSPRSGDMGARYFPANRWTGRNGAPVSTRDSHVSIVDDLSVREGGARLIRSAGLSVEIFGSAQEFLASPQAEAPSCLVLDVQLPGLSGLNLQQQPRMFRSRSFSSAAAATFQYQCAPRREPLPRSEVCYFRRQRNPQL
jgi:hypothetical protein